MGQTEIVVTMEDRQLLPHPAFALAQRTDPAPDRGNMLPDGEVKPLHEGGIGGSRTIGAESPDLIS
jgi:hypothetical protein